MDVGAGDLGAEKIERVERWQSSNTCGESAESLDGAKAIGVEDVVNVIAEVGADGVG